MAHNPEARDVPAAMTADVTTVRTHLTRHDFMYYNWVLALERPILPFFMYTFVLLVMSSLLGVWPAGRLYAPAVLIPALGYTLFVWLSSRQLWRHVQQTLTPQTYIFKTKSYLNDDGKTKQAIPYQHIKQLLESRQAFYLVLQDGSASILPKRDVTDSNSLRALIQSKLTGRYKHSSFL